MAAATKQKLWLEVQLAVKESERRATAGQYAAAIMHEINNPLESILNLAYLIQQEAGDTSKVREYANLLESELENVIRIAKQTLSFYGPSDARQNTDLALIAESALQVHAGKVASKQIHLVRDVSKNAVAEVHAGEMLQVLSNLIGNAVDALSDDGTLRIRVRRSEQEIHVTIADDGQGIPDKVLSRVFDPFFTTKKERGTGLGLAVSKAIVEGHRGRIRVRSTVRRGRSGTAFRVSLPLQAGLQQ